MLGRDWQDVIAGALLVTVGLSVGVHTAYHYHLGTIMHMGPGMYPAALGFILAGIGALILIPAWFRAGAELPKPDLRSLVAVLAGVLAFALTVRPFGMVPAVIALTIAAALADNKLNLVGALILSAVLSTIAWLIFRVGLGIPLQTINWPF